ncbi:hypothetical protein [uncultured Roseobacter sp.]|uniref:hypothetical protein n=1 Tax=uncultured Roseobacter sp. TaxID=114847 RepID=UPI00262736CE|nr:hypothetical protein [uncultured Roseobacter sp.]
MKLQFFATAAAVAIASQAAAVDYNLGLTGGGDAFNMTGTLSEKGTGSVSVTVPVTDHSDAYTVGGSVNVTKDTSIYGSVTEVPGDNNDVGTIGIRGSF